MRNQKLNNELEEMSYCCENDQEFRQMVAARKKSNTKTKEGRMQRLIEFICQWISSFTLMILFVMMVTLMVMHATNQGVEYMIGVVIGCAVIGAGISRF